MQYNFTWKKRFFWKTIKVIGHGYDEKQNKMILYMPDGAIREISEWNKCEVSLKSDWVLAIKKDAESKAGITIPLAVG